MLEVNKQYYKVVARAWSDPEFKARLLADPKGVLEEHGVSLGAEYDAAEIVMLEDSATVKHVVVPSKDGSSGGDCVEPRAADVAPERG